MNATMVAVLLYIQWTKARHRAKLSKWILSGKFQLYSNVIIIPRDGGQLKSNKPISRAMKHCDHGHDYPHTLLIFATKVAVYVKVTKR